MRQGNNKRAALDRHAARGGRGTVTRGLRYCPMNWPVIQMRDDACDKIDELDRLLNDPDVTMVPSQVWALADEIAAQAAERAG